MIDEDDPYVSFTYLKYFSITVYHCEIKHFNPNTLIVIFVRKLAAADYEISQALY